jgi:hypothetical protein
MSAHFAAMSLANLWTPGSSVVQRMCEGGRKLQKQMRAASCVRGRVCIEQKQDPSRHRTVLVATLNTEAQRDRIPRLYDVTLIRSTSDCWTLAGYERILSGPLGHEYAVAQTWLIELAAVDALIAAEQRFNQLSAEAHELRERLKSLTAS